LRGTPAQQVNTDTLILKLLFPSLRGQVDINIILNPTLVPSRNYSTIRVNDPY
jgi:hypothetical protein